METIWIALFIWLLLLAGSCLQGTIGFGMGIFAAGWMGLFLPVKDVTLILLALTVIMSAWVVVKLRAYVEWTMIAKVLAGTIIGRIGSFWFIHTLGESLLAKRCLGAALIAIVILIHLNKRYEDRWREAGHAGWIAAAIGLIGGFVGGAFAIGGPIYAIYFLVAFRDKRQYHVNMQFTFIVSNLFTLTIHGLSGDMGSQFWFYTLTGIIPVLLGVRIGYGFFSRISRKTLERATSSMVVAAAILMVFVYR